MKIGYRTIKTAVGTPVAIWIAEMLQLTNFASAGIITLLCIQPTRKKSFLSSWHRFGACLIAMLYSFLIFETIGYHPLAIGILLILFIPTTVWLKLTPGIVTSSVIILHLYSAEFINVSLVMNELAIIIIGIGMALLLNLYMPSLDRDIMDMQDQLEKNITVMLKEIAIYLKEGRETWTGKEIIEIEAILNKSEKLVIQDVENKLFQQTNPYAEYFSMRRKQFDLLKRMLPLLSHMPELYQQSYRMGMFFDDLADAVHPGNTASVHLQTVRKLKEEFSKSELPKTRKEFESRADLFRLLHEIENYLLLKKNETPNMSQKGKQNS
ncbi:aromatic acid exporter family protein [Aquibacillus sediminis]|uniref:aromatic acid exporter family protein n=1 Tax=Aquibacillus sediminis TaxID=2574734 RepID=UPI001FE7A2C6|nr:aromatic acid exporter family protein [Aquibacillus sediminis]